MTRRKITFTLASSSIIAALAFLPGGAHAKPRATSTDEARALAWLEVRQVVGAPGTAAPGPVTSSDEARVAAGAALPPLDERRPSGTGTVTSTDEARAAFAAGRACDPPVALAAAPGAPGDCAQ